MTSIAFNQQFDQHHAWREDMAQRVRTLTEWLKTRDLLDDAAAERLQQV